MRKILAVAAVMTVATVALAAPYNSQGFEAPTFATGPLNGQDGWVAGLDGSGMEPVVVTAPDPVMGDQSVRLEVPDVQGSNSWMEHAADLTSAIGAGEKVVISFDIYRSLNSEGKLQNMWFWLWDAGTPTYGLQWDAGPSTLPYGWNPNAGSVPTVVDRWANLTLEYDFGTMTCSSWYDGALVDNQIAINPNGDDPITSITGFTIVLGHDAGDGTGGDVAFIDNFSMTPEPASLLLVALGALIRRR